MKRDVLLHRLMTVWRDSLELLALEAALGWRMALAKDLLLRHREIDIADVAERVGYRIGVSTFSTAFSRYVGQPPGRYSQSHHGIQQSRLLARVGQGTSSAVRGLGASPSQVYLPTRKRKTNQNGSFAVSSEAASGLG